MNNGQKVNVLLLGNGINRAYDFGSWDNLLKSIQKQELTIDQQKTLDGIPYPLIFYVKRVGLYINKHF